MKLLAPACALSLLSGPAFASATLVAACAPAWAARPTPQAPPDAADLSEAIEAIRAETGAPGLVAAAFQDGRIVAWGVAGLRAAGSDAPLELGDPMHLGSCAKAMTATMIARLVEEGALRFETTLAEGLPELAKRIDPGFHGATLDQLLRHRAGIAERRRPELEALHPLMEELEGTDAEVRLEVLARVMATPPLAPEIGKFDYSNFGYMAAAAVAEAATKKTWAELMAEKVFVPLGMESAGVGSPCGDDVPVGHRPGETGLVPLPPGPDGALPGCMAPAGLVHASLVDWGRFVADHMRGERGEDGLLKAATYRHLHARIDGSPYAAGWFVAPRSVSWSEPTLAYSHSGSDNTWLSVVEAVPEWDLAVLAAANCAEPAGPAACERARDLLLETLGFKD